MANKLTPPPPTGNGLLDRWLALLWRLLTAPGQLLKEQISDFAHNHTADADGGALTNDLHDGYIEVATSAAPGTPASGKVRIYAQDAAGVGRLRVVHSSGSDLAMFRDAVVRVKNTSGVTINKGEVAYVTGATGNFPTIAKAKANAAATMPAAGMVLTTAADNAFTTLQFSGEMTGIDTSAFAEGARVFVSATTAGAITATEPQHPNLSQAVGVITKASAGDGRIQLFISLQHEGDDFGSNRNTFSIGDGGAGAKVLAFVNAFIGSLSWQPTAARTITLPDATGTVALTNNKLSAFAATTSAELAGVISDETGSGALVFGTSPTLTGPTISSGNLTFSGSAQRITGDMSTATVANRLAFQTSVTNGNTNITLMPNGTGSGANFQMSQSSDLNNAAILSLGIPGSINECRLNSGGVGTFTYLPFTFYTSGLEAMRLAIDQHATFGATIKPKGYTVATLPTAGTVGRMAYVTDAVAPTYLGALTGGGTVKVPVFDNGTAWVSH